MHFSRLMTVLALLLCAMPAFAQAIVLRPADVIPRLQEVSEGAFYLNGPETHGLVPGAADKIFPLGDTAKYVLALTTLRLADKGMIDLDAPVGKSVPDLIEFYPFEVAITPKHLLTETAGFARPVEDAAMDAPLAYFLVKVRGAGQISVPDPVGWHLLAALIERTAGKDIQQVVQDELFAPLGVTDAVQSGHPPGADKHRVPLSSLKIKLSTVTRLARFMLNSDPLGAPAFLTAESYALLARGPVWRMHPMAPAHQAGGVIRSVNGRHLWQVGLSPQSTEGIWLIALPKEGLLFISPYKTPFDAQTFQMAVQSIVHDFLPPGTEEDRALAEASRLVPPAEIGHRFHCAASSAALADRVQNAKSCFLNLIPASEGSFFASLSDDSRALIYQNQVPYVYKPNLQASDLVLSPFKAGGYAVLGDRTYVRVDTLGLLQARAGDFLPLIILTLATAIFHLRSETSVQWRRMAAFCVIGGTLVSIGLYADWHYWAAVLYDWQMPWLVMLWRAGLNIGLMLLLAVPMLSTTFIRTQNMPTQGFALLFAGPHLGLLSLAAIALFLVTVFWGLAGTFAAY